MKTLWKKYLSVFLLIAVVVSAFAVMNGCQNETGDKEGDGTKTPGSTEEERLYPDLPESDFKGYTFTFDQWDIDGWGMIKDIFAEASDETKVGAAVYRRNSIIEDQYKIEIELVQEDINTIQQTYQQQVSAGDQDFDVFLVRGHEMQFVLPADLCLDLYDLPHCDFTKPWWDANSVAQFSIDNRLYMVESDMTLRDKNATACVMFNKAVQEDYQIGDIYSLVETNEWTWEKMIELARKATHDNGDSQWDENDTYGWVSLDDITYIMLHGADARYATKDENDLPVPGFGEVRTLEVAQTITDILYKADYFWHLSKTTDPSGSGQLFPEDRALFYTDAIFRAQSLNDMETDFGIMPVPKYDETQETYGHSVSIHFTSAITVPKTNNNLERTSIILEALAAESKYTVIPEYYDVYVKIRNTRDEEAKAMLDLIFDTRVYDMGEYFQFGYLNSYFLRIWTNKQFDNVNTLYAAYKDAVQQSIEDFLEKVVKEDA